MRTILGRERPVWVLLSISRFRSILDFGRPQDVAVADGTVEAQRARVLAAVKTRRSAPPLFRRAEGLDGGSAHARPEGLLHDGDSDPAPTCCSRRPVQIPSVPGVPLTGALETENRCAVGPRPFELSTPRHYADRHLKRDPCARGKLRLRQPPARSVAYPDVPAGRRVDAVCTNDSASCSSIWPCTGVRPSSTAAATRQPGGCRLAPSGACTSTLWWTVEERRFAGGIGLPVRSVLARALRHHDDHETTRRRGARRLSAPIAARNGGHPLGRLPLDTDQPQSLPYEGLVHLVHGRPGPAGRPDRGERSWCVAGSRGHNERMASCRN